MRLSKLNPPFSGLYRQIAPEDFIRLFAGELPQTVAFILSFCRKRSFVKKVIQLYDKDGQDTSEDAPQDCGSRNSLVIREYLNRCSDETLDPDFVRMVEVRADKIMRESASNSASGLSRKKFKFPYPKVPAGG